MISTTFNFLCLMFFIFASASGFQPDKNIELVVAKDGSGQFVTIQSAIDAVESDNNQSVYIKIKNGTYNEKLFITKSNITFVGEDRHKTQIIFAELRSNWRKDNNDNDWGSAVINIADGVSNITIANLTVYNNYGSLFGDNDHQFAIRGFDIDKIILINCDIKADGGDTVSLWNPEFGKYYHYNCNFEGYVDFVCPRGWCYITDSKFYQLSSKASASIWHDGSFSEQSKFVIKNSYFDGVPHFVLGRNHRDGQFFLIDCVFSENMKDQKMFLAPSNPVRVFKWGERYYYYNCVRESGDYDWHADNLNEAVESPEPEKINAEWTFATAPEKWNPETELDNILPYAEFPSPGRNSMLNQSGSVTLKWKAGIDAESYDIYFGKTSSLAFSGSSRSTEFNIDDVSSGEKYYWQINTITKADTITGEIWTFTTY
ncbi:MAG: pectin esterase [Ignavibacteriales bacterium]|nr:MAG: pectin esterase [Ignavibacteriales bacterium]